ncbi:DUF2188 domain-containing protein [Streptomyces sp. DSM 44915]|uniref:DUF2188 domain-containing protein n=1 Tax=Streptomyces chisholmiae TaxID=3075540 RepID=A0ABU2K0U0_9ACTN|nr:DUF2188 domain-containing protein [Streptomyces sp. DSM 44915]MDT0270598.1 DUF2188 domain-containing protein [Streptomyces sp. DSM 44915]
MAMTFRMTGDDQEAEIYDETGRIGILYHVEPDEEDLTSGWVVELNGYRLGNSRATALLPTAAEAVEAARPLYEELLEHRRYVARVEGRHRFISTPMGGQPK